MLLKFIFKNNKKRIQKNLKFDIKSWMNLTREQRLEIDSKEKDESMRKKKALLKSIREEYIKLKKNK